MLNPTNSMSAPDVTTYRSHAERDTSSRTTACRRAVLDALDCGVLLVTRKLGVRYRDRTAAAHLGGDRERITVGVRLTVGHVREAEALARAVAAAADRGLRYLHARKADGVCGKLTVMQASHASARVQPLVLVQVGKAESCSRLSVKRFASLDGLSGAGAGVLGALTTGRGPQEMAQCQQVRSSAIRTHIKRIRCKTGARRHRHLVLRIARLPPLLAPTG
jgi:DNA-binding CsgD family transcriptional regulator